MYREIAADKVIAGIRGKYGAWQSWQNMISQGEVDPRWLDFENFYRDMGDRPRGHVLKRIHGDDYRPGNCRWTTP